MRWEASNRVSMEEVGQQLSILHDSVEDAVQGGALRLEICPEKDAGHLKLIIHDISKDWRYIMFMRVGCMLVQKT